MNARSIFTRRRPILVLLLGVAPLSVHAQSLPDWGGYWIGEGLTAEISGFPGESGDYKLLGQDAPWSEEGLKRVQATRARQMDQKAGCVCSFVNRESGIVND